MASLDLRIEDSETTNAEMPDHAFGARQLFVGAGMKSFVGNICVGIFRSQEPYDMIARTVCRRMDAIVDKKMC